MRYVFGPYELDTRRYRLRRQGEVVPIDRKAFDTLLLLVECRDRVVAKEEILERVWADTVVVDGVVPAAIRRIRIALSQEHGAKRPIETVHGRGYRFSDDVVEFSPEPSTVSNLPPPPRPDGSSPDIDPEPFVGRKELVRRLAEALLAAQEGHGRLVLLSGESGVGKTRLVERFGRLARASGTPPWFARCYEDAGAPALFPWTLAIRAAADALSPEELARVPADVLIGLSDLVTELSPRGSSGGRRRLADPVASRYRLFDGITRFFTAVSALSPRLVVLDDLQWADLQSLQVLDFVAAKITEVPLLVVGTLRELPAGTDDPRAGLLARLTRQHGCERLVVPRLTKTEVGEYVAATSSSGAGAEVVDWVWRTTGGNAFTLRETVRSLGASPGGFAGTEGRGATPEAAKELVGRIVARLSPGARRAVSFASVLGGPFTSTLVARALGIEPGEARDCLEEAESLGVAMRSGHGRFELSHDLVRDPVYAALDFEERRTAHLAAALALETEGGTSSEIALHFHRGRPHAHAGSAARHARLAAEAAERIFAHDEAARLYGLSLDAVASSGAPDDPHVTAGLWLLLARALVAAGRLAEAESAVACIRDISRTLAAPALLAEAALTLRPIGELWASGDRGRDALEEALASIPDDQRSLRARILASLSMGLPLTMPDGRRQDLAARAVALADGLLDRETTARVQTARLNALLGPDHVDALVEASGDVIRLARERGMPELEIAARSLGALAHLTRSDVPTAAREYEEIRRLATEIGSPPARWRADNARAAFAIAAGRFEEAEAEIRAGYRTGRRFQGSRAELVMRAQMQELDWLRGRPPSVPGFDAERFLERFAWAGVPVVSWVSLLQLEMGDREGARRSFDRLADRGFESIPKTAGHLTTLRALALVAVGLGDRSRAELLAELMRPYAHLNVVAEFAVCSGPLSYYLGLVEELLGRYEEAQEHLSLALSLSDAAGMRPMGAKIRKALGDLLVVRSGPDGSRGAALLTEAERMAAELKMGGISA